MKAILTICLLILWVCSCSENNSPLNARRLTYASEVEILDKSKSEWLQDYILQRQGDSVEIVYDSRGNIRMDYFGSGPMGMSYNFYNAREHMNSSKWKNIDTIYFYDTTINEFNLDSSVRVKTEGGFILKFYSQHPHDSRGIVQEFHFLDDSLKVNGQLYRDFKDFSFADIMSEANSFPIKTIVTAEGVRKTRKLIRIKSIIDPDESLFMRDDNLSWKRN